MIRVLTKRYMKTCTVTRKRVLDSDAEMSDDFKQMISFIIFSLTMPFP